MRADLQLTRFSRKNCANPVPVSVTVSVDLPEFGETIVSTTAGCGVPPGAVAGLVSPAPATS